MKNKLIYFTFIFILFCGSLFSQETVQSHAVKIQWNGVEEWSNNQGKIRVLSFKNISFPDNNFRKPVLNQKYLIDSKTTYRISADSLQLTPLTDGELNLVDTAEIESQPKISQTVLSAKGTNYLSVNISPFVKQNGIYYKIASLKISLNQTTGPQKTTTSTIHTYADNSVLASGKFVKIRISASGVYKLTYDDLSSMGIDPANVRIFGYGGNVLNQNFYADKIDDLPEVAIYMNKGSDGVFNSGDYILFYAVGINKWAFDYSKKIFTHTINTYSNYGYYFVTSDAGSGRKIETQTYDIPEDAVINQVDQFSDYAVYEKELRNIASSGKTFYGEIFSPGTSASLSFNFPNSVSGSPAKVKLDVAATSSVMSNFALTLNSTSTQSLYVAAKSSDTYVEAMSGSSVLTYTPSGDSFNFNLTYNSSNSTAIAYLNYVEITARRYLKMNGSCMQFQNIDNLYTDSYNQYLLSGANSNTQIWNIADPTNIVQVTTQTDASGNLTFTAPAYDLISYIAIDPTSASSFSKPEIIGSISNQNLHALSDIDMVIITPSDFLTQANKLAQAHAEADQLSVAVVTTDQVYNEFSSGTPDATAYRWIMKMLYDRAQNSGNTVHSPKYLLLFGKGSFDNRKIISTSNNLILTYQADESLTETSSYVTDDYFTLLDDSEGSQPTSGLMDISVGRFPVTTSEQATNVVDKTIGYMNNSLKGIWKNQLCFLADDGDAALHMRQADSVASIVTRKYPAYQVNKIYLDSYQQITTASGQSYPLARTQFLNLVNKGLLLLDYTGHAGYTGWTNELILTTNDVKTMANTQLPLWVGATCDFLQFDNNTVSAGEYVLLNSVGGGIGILSAARPVYANQNFNVNRLLCDNLFGKINGEVPRIGDAIAYAKNNISPEINKLCYVYMGDPAVKLNYPTDYSVQTTFVNQVPASENDTLRALSLANIQGIVADENGNKVSDFNGIINVVVYDKIQSITTLNNEGDGALTYKYRPNTLFSGKVYVKEGDFSFSFKIPKDIKYNFGSGRINYYAQDTITTKEAQGYFENFTIGGTDTTAATETAGPEMSLYLNSRYFKNGGNVDESPLFIADLNDVNGINQVGSGIGHDISLTIDSDASQTYVLNDYYSAEIGSYTTGTIQYKLSDLSDGKHTLTLRAWDLQNNSTTKTLDFNVVTGLTPQIFNISCYPNPIKSGSVTIKIAHDRPSSILYTKVDIFDLAGRLIWTFSQNNADSIQWDLTGGDGQKVKSGLYLYRVSIHTSDSDSFSKTNKILILE